MILTDVGEIGVTAGGRSVVLRPSLYAIGTLGDGAEIVRTYAAVMAGSLVDSLGVLFACCGEDVSDIFGHMSADGRYNRSIADPADIVLLAQCLMRHGVGGALQAEKPRPEDDQPKYSAEFDVRANAATAVAHLGMSEREAWDMTMTGLVLALRSKFPPAKSNAPGSGAPTLEEHDAAMEWYDRVEAARAKMRGE